MKASRLATLLFFMLAGTGCGNNSSGPITWRVERGQFVQEVTARGQLVSVGGVEVCCEVDDSASISTKILWLVPEGSNVEPAPGWDLAQDLSGTDPPDLLVKLDSSRLENRRNEERIICNDSQAGVIQAKSRCEAATAALKGFEELAVESERRILEAEIATLKADLFDAQDKLERGQQAFADGIVSRSGLNVLKFEFAAIERQLKVPQVGLQDLDKRASGSTRQLELELDAAKAELDSKESNHRLNVEKLATTEARIEACTIRAPVAGQVLHATVVDKVSGLKIAIQEGMSVRAGQTLLQLWNREQVKMKTRIGEAWISTARKGMTSTVRLDAFSDLEISGVVDDVSVYPVARPASGTAEYETTIRLTGDSSLPLRPGLTGEARITVQSLPSVLKIPKDAVLWRDSKAYSILHRDRSWEARQVQISTGDGTICVVSAGLKEGEEVVRNAEQYGDKITWP